MTATTESVLLAVGAAGATGALGYLAFRAAARRSVTAAAVIASTTTVAALVAGFLAATRTMVLSEDDLGVVLAVSMAAGLVSLVFGLALGRRLTGLQREAAAAEERRERERMVEAERRHLVALVSHDLRTPLADLRAMAESLEDGVVADPARYHTRMRVEVERLSGLVDDLFALSRLQSGSWTPTFDDVLVADVVSDTLASCEASAAERGVVLDGVADGPLPVRADEREVQRAVANLVVNAIRHTPPGGRVQVRAAALGGGVRVSVTDGCGGIPAEDLPHVFDVAWRGSAARTPGDDGGAGLGLAIVAAVAAAHGGEVEVANVTGGCRFVLVLPAHPSPRPLVDAG